MTRLIAINRLTTAILIALMLIACAEKQQVVGNQEAGKHKTRKEVAELDDKAHHKSTVYAQAEPVLASREARSKPAVPAGMTSADAAQAMGYYLQPPMPVVGPQPNRENYTVRNENSFISVADQPVSTFSIDVDTASYANTRRILNGGQMPPPEAVRVEEFINYFDYHYPAPDNQKRPFSVSTEIAASPWSKGKHLLHIGLQGYQVPMSAVPPSNLVFLLDVSGSMAAANKLPLLKQSVKLLSRQLREEDRVSIVVYAGASGVVLEPVKGNQTRKIHSALDRLRAGGSTNGASGIQLAYQLAREAFIEDGINRVILATDGDFNVGLTSLDQLKQLVKKQRKSGIELTTLGFGRGNYNDALMNELAEIGNGNSSYIDNALEANKALVSELTSTLFTIAKDVKIQIEFSPQVAEYRLIGYESRLLNREDFNNDKKDAGEIGAGHSVTALYEITLAGSPAKLIDPLRYSHNSASDKGLSLANELAYLKLRYKLPGKPKSTLVEQPVYRNTITALADTSDNFRWSAAVAGFAQLLRDSDWTDSLDYREVLALAQGARGNDANGYRAEMIKLVKMADILAAGDFPSGDKSSRG